jgi:2-polyprenyl-3-methyl-5-hydroxy-6-metoxy-1,4-benzoquinol methylase
LPSSGQDPRGDPSAGLGSRYHEHYLAINPQIAGEAAYREASYCYRIELLPLLPVACDCRILDLGSGAGFLLRFLAEQGYTRVGGVELDAELCRLAQEKVGKQAEFIQQADAREFLAAHGQCFDVVLATDFIEHFTLTEALDLARLIHAALTPGGRLILRTPNMASPLACYSRYMDLTHRHGYTDHSLMQLLRLAGFAEARVHVPAWPRLSLRTWRRRLLRLAYSRLFRWEGRVPPRAFEKNLIVWATKSSTGAHRVSDD